MPIPVKEILDACELIAQQDCLKVCVNESMKGAVVAGMGSFLGGIILGPPGIAIGAAVGGGIAASSVCNDYKPLLSVIQEMNGDDKQRLAEHMNGVLTQLGITSGAALIAIAQDKTAGGREAVVKELGNFFKG